MKTCFHDFSIVKEYGDYYDYDYEDYEDYDKEAYDDDEYEEDDYEGIDDYKEDNVNYEDARGR